MILLDLLKAFDTIDHNTLCNKLKLIDIRLAKWFESYLASRWQLVNIGKTNSDTADVTYCVHNQGSILGQLLFLYYINDMMIRTDRDCNVDDTCSKFLFLHRDKIVNKLGIIIKLCSDWLVDNELSLHLGKIEWLLFRYKEKLSKVKGLK